MYLWSLFFHLVCVLSLSADLCLDALLPRLFLCCAAPPTPKMFEWMAESRAQLLWLLTFVFVAATDGSIVNPSISLYLQELDSTVSNATVGLAIGLFPLGLMAGLIGIQKYNGQKRARTVLAGSLVLLVVSNAAYSLSGSIPVILLSRLIAGLASSAMMLAFALGPRLLTQREKNDKYQASIRAIATAGSVVGPLLASLLTLPPAADLSGVRLDEYTLPGLVTAALFALLLPLLLAVFPKPDPHEAVAAAPANPSVAPTGDVQERDGGLLALVTTIVMCTSVQFCYMAVVTFNTESTSAAFGWGVRENAYLFGVCGATQVLIALPGYWWPKVDARFTGAAMTVLQVLALCGTMWGNNNLVLYIASVGLVGACYARLNNDGMQLFMHLYRDAKRAPMPLLMSAITLSRALGSVLTGLIQSQASLRAAVGLSLAVALATCVLTFVAFPKLVFRTAANPIGKSALGAAAPESDLALGLKQHIKLNINENAPLLQPVSTTQKDVAAPSAPLPSAKV
jgi:MFS family permease